MAYSDSYADYPSRRLTAVALLVGAAVFLYDLIYGFVCYIGHSIFAPSLFSPDAHTRLRMDSMERELRAETIELTALGQRFKAFIPRRREHAYASDGGFMPEIAHPAV